MKVSIRDISLRTGYSQATISNALNYKKGVNKDTASEIFKAAKEMGYISENQILKVRLVVYKGNGQIIQDSPFAALLINGVEKECRSCGMEMSVCYLNRHDADYNEQVNRIIHDRSSAVIMLGTELMEEDISIYQSASCPFIMLDYWNWNLPFSGVLINNADSARTAVDYLIKKGHQEIGYLRGEYRIEAFKDRSIGYRTAMRYARLAINKDYVLTLGTSINDAYISMKKHLDKNIYLPTAFFADNDMIALGVMKALKEKGIEVPRDISIIGFDDLPYSELSSPPLTTLRVPKQEMGSLAVKRVKELINQNCNIKTKILVCTDFVERESVRNIRGE